MSRTRRPTQSAPGTSPAGRDTPFGAGIRLGRWAGVPVRAHWSVLVTVGVLAYLLATITLPAARPGAAAAAYWATGTVMALVLLLTLVAHELAHAVAAHHHDLEVTRITLWMLGGMTEIGGRFPTPRADAGVAAAGPVASLGLGGVLGAAAWLVGDDGLIGYALVWLAVTNLVLGILNLVPGAPLDGGRLLRALIWWRRRDRALGALWAARVGRVLGATLVGMGCLQVLVGDPAGGWSVLLGWFVLGGAASEQYAVRAECLHGVAVREVMSPAVGAAPAWWTVEQLVAAPPSQAACPPVLPLVDIEGHLVGAITRASIDDVPVGRRTAVHLGDLAQRSTRPPLRTGPDEDVADLLLPLHLRGGFAVVVADGKPVGVVSDADLERAARTRTAQAHAERGP